MLNAEHVALESRLVQQMVAIRQRELEQQLSRYTAIGTQASLLAGFAIGVLSSLTPSDGNTTQMTQTIFYLSSVLCVLCAMHVVACTMCTSPPLDPRPSGRCVFANRSRP
jgi:hypothetical protein